MSKAQNAPRAPVLNRPTVIVPSVPYDITTVFGLVEALGGVEAVAREYETPPERVTRWAISGDIPPGWHLRIFGKVCALGKTIAPTVFGFREDDGAARALSRLMMQEGANV